MITDDIIKAAASKFMGWPIPADFYPDAYITFDRVRAAANNCTPTGTNLLHVGQALQMFEYCLGEVLATEIAAASQGEQSSKQKSQRDEMTERALVQQMLEALGHFDDVDKTEKAITAAREYLAESEARASPEQSSKQKSRETNKALAKPLSDVFRNFGKEPEIMPLIDAYATARGEVGNEHFSHECLALREQIRTKLLGEQASKRVALTDADMVWNREDAEKPHDSISCFLNDEICNGYLEVGATFEMMQAKRLPNVIIRVTSIDEENCEAEYEVIEAPITGEKT